MNVCTRTMCFRRQVVEDVTLCMYVCRSVCQSVSQSVSQSVNLSVCLSGLSATNQYAYIRCIHACIHTCIPTYMDAELIQSETHTHAHFLGKSKSIHEYTRIQPQVLMLLGLQAEIKCMTRAKIHGSSATLTHGKSPALGPHLLW